jgi:glycosyltransferase involved in cell wall biosynthesis
MHQPLISVCLPNRNTFPYLQERVDTIFGQTYKNWELIVSDNFSEDGAWPFFERIARKDSRVSIAQAPLGMYDGWNDCIRRARGEYIYIATSDDTMAPDCLGRLVFALEEHPECDVANCRLRLIDESGRQLEDGYSTWGIFALSSGKFSERRHLRIAPFDGLLHLSGYTVYPSITQLLIRKKLFAKVGYFETRWGSVGDFNWHMRAGLVANTVHVPDTWGGWRIHGGQVTSRVKYFSIEHERKIQEMIVHAIQATKPFVAPAAVERLQRRWATNALRLRNFLNGIRERHDSKPARRLFILRELLRGEFAALSHISAKAAKRPIWPEKVEEWMLQIGVKSAVVPL